MPKYPTVTLQAVVDDIASLIGSTWNDLNGNTDITNRLVTFVNDRQDEGLDEYDWPSYNGFEKRYFEYGKWFAGSYPDTAIVYYEPNDKYYKNTSGGSTSGVPGTSGDWEEENEFSTIISYTQPYDSASTDVDEIWACYNEDPNGDLYREPYPMQIASSDWTDADTSTTYDAVHVAKTGINYVWIKYSNYPTAHSRSDTSTTLPRWLKGFIVRAVYSDWLTSEGQHDKARAEEKKAFRRLGQQYDKLLYRQGQNANENKTVYNKEYS